MRSGCMCTISENPNWCGVVRTLGSSVLYGRFTMTPHGLRLYSNFDTGPCERYSIKAAEKGNTKAGRA